MHDDRYDRDVLSWSANQADRLRAMAHGGPPDGIDWLNVAEEIEALGKRELREVRALLLRGLEHMLRAAGWPASRDVKNWLREAGTFLNDAKLAFTPSMAHSLDVEELYDLALRAVLRLDYEEGASTGLFETCPFTLPDLIPAGRGKSANPIELVGRLRAAG